MLVVGVWYKHKLTSELVLYRGREIGDAGATWVFSTHIVDPYICYTEEEVKEFICQ